MPPRRRQARRRQLDPPSPAQVTDETMGDPEIAAIIAEAPRSPRMPTHVPGWVRSRGLEFAREWIAEQAEASRRRIADLIERVPPEVEAEGPAAVEVWAIEQDDPRRAMLHQLSEQEGRATPRAPLPR
ncbi:MAG TPA: hypothetical protein VG816_13760 [Solirubrobacterales bacterium]|nr:hypothetical protein [Solirubrobacterales bacterium]